jgi:RNA polymerase sigma-70 factor, ECF subfamily
MSGPDLVLQMYLVGQRAWPALALELETFAAFCKSALAAGEGVPFEARDLYLCCACAQGQPEALRSFETECLSVAKAAIRRIDNSEDFARDTLQELWSKLLVGADARVRSYSGRGPLQAWVRVAATRVALDRQRTHKRGMDRQVELSEKLAADDLGIEATLLKARFGSAFQVALEASISTLSKQERNVLRMHVVGQCSIDEIGRAYEVHRATAARWIDRSRAKIYEGVRQALCVEHKLTESEFDSLATLVGAELSLRLSAGPSSTSLPGGAA